MKNVVARPGLEPRASHILCEHSTTELPSQPVTSPTTLHHKPNPVTHYFGKGGVVKNVFPINTGRLLYYSERKGHHISLKGF